ncbi:MAG: hypothetical protein QM484_07100 [Woeseiaceae bacterium]
MTAHFETGTEGFVWSLEIDGMGYDGLYSLKNDDELIVYTKNRCAIIWKGIVQLECERLYTPYPNNPQYGRQVIDGLWVKGFQYNLHPHVWGKWFLDELPAALLRNNSKS